MTSKGMMDPRYTRAVKSTENVFTPRELQMMDINPKNLMKAECTPYFEDNYTDKIKLKNTVIKNADAGLYEFFAKEVECSDEFIRGKERIKQSLKKTINAKKKDDNMNSTKSKKELNKKIIDYEKEMIVIFRKMSRICQNKAKGLCDIRDKSDDQYTKDALKELLMDKKSGDKITVEEEIDKQIQNMDQDKIKEKIKRNNPRFKHLLELSDEDLGLGRKMLLMINGFIRKGDNWKYDPKLEERFVNAASICRKKNLCVKTEFADIPKEIGSFTEAIIDGISTPFYYLSKKGTKMLEVSKQRSIEKQQDISASRQKKIEKFEAERKALEDEKKKAKETVESDGASEAERKKAQASINAIKKREKRLDEGKNFSIRNLSRSRKSITQLKLNKVKTDSKIEKKQLEKAVLSNGPKTPFFISRMTKKSDIQRSKNNALKQAFGNIKTKKREKQLELLKAKNNDVGLTTVQARKRDRKEYRLNPSQESSLKRFRAQEGQKELDKLKELGQLTSTQKDRMKVLEDGRFRMGFGTNSVKTLKKKTETNDEKTNRLSGERKELLTKKAQRTLSKNDQRRLDRIDKGTSRLGFGKKSLGALQGKSKLNRKFNRKKAESNALRERQLSIGDKTKYSNKEEKRMEKLDSNLKGLQTKKNNRNNLLKKQETRALGIRERSKLRSLEGTRFFSRKTQDKKDREKEASDARLNALEKRYLNGKRLSLNNTRKLYRDSGSNFRERQEKDLERLTKRKEKGTFTPKDQKRFERLQRQIQLFKNPKTRKNIFTRKIMRGEQEMEALNKQKALGDMGNESSKRQKELNLELNELRKIQAKRNVNKIGREAVRDLERQRLLEQEQEQTEA